MKIGIYITTYQKENKESLVILQRAIDSIKKQTYKDYKVYVIFDEYTDKEQMDKIREMLPDGSYTHNTEKAYWKNFPNDKRRRWCCGGLNSTKHAINKILEDGIDWVCRLDHDDWWEDNHLELIVDRIKKDNDLVFVTTRGKLGNLVLPPDGVNGDYYPVKERIFHSTTCINFRKVPLRYEDPYLNGYRGPGDAWLWMRLNKYMKDNKLRGYCIPEITLLRESEADILKK
jgi:glycosyltransferase involved in cell wall biosynthesis